MLYFELIIQIQIVNLKNPSSCKCKNYNEICLVYNYQK